MDARRRSPDVRGKGGSRAAGAAEGRREVVGARLTAPQPLSRGDDVPADAVAAACSIAVADIETASPRALRGLLRHRFHFRRIEGAAGVASGAGARFEVFSRNFAVDGATGIHLYVRDGSEGVDIRARMFAPLHGVPEDPATGSANVALAGLLASLRPEPDLRCDCGSPRGSEMGRPSLLDASAEKRGGRVTETRIGGRCVAVMSGTSTSEITARTKAHEDCTPKRGRIAWSKGYCLPPPRC